MLEKLRPEREWQWAACGKHPAAKDYFTVGQDFPLRASFSTWIETGYQVAVSKRDRSAKHLWRFWTREARRDNVVCGIIRDSVDGIGRPYPLLIIGTGPMKDWAVQWDLVPLACDAAWTAMEDLSTGNLANLRDLDEEVRNVKRPVAEWLQLARKRELFRDFESPPVGHAKGTMPGLTENVEYFSMAQFSRRDTRELAGLYHSFMRAHVEAAPTTTFMGGTTDGRFIIFFRRPLTPSDFITLWSIGSDESPVRNYQ